MSGLVLPAGGRGDGGTCHVGCQDKYCRRGVGGTCHVACQDKYCRQGVGALEALAGGRAVGCWRHLSCQHVRTSTAGRG